MNLTSRSEYGLLALIELARSEDGGPLSVRAIAEEREIPESFLEQLFASLRRAAIVSSKRGPRGGFTLSRPAEEITALDIVEALEGPLRPSMCAATAACERQGSCAAVWVWDEVTDAVRETLAGFTLAELARRQCALDEVG